METPFVKAYPRITDLNENRDDLIGLLKEKLLKYDWNTEIAYAVILAESGGNPNAFNPEWHFDYLTKKPICQGSYSVFQLACIHGRTEDLKDLDKNIEIAYNLQKKRGWDEWTTYANGTYLKYLIN